MSHPVRVRGLKSGELGQAHGSVCVAPRAGAWIEIAIRWWWGAHSAVAPRAGAWMEIVEGSVMGLSEGGRSPCGCVD